MMQSLDISAFLPKIYISILLNSMEIEKQEESEKLESCPIKTITIAFPLFYWDRISPFLSGHWPNNQG